MESVSKSIWLMFAIASCVIFGQAHGVDGNIVIHFRNGTSVAFNSVPIKFDGNVRDFENVTAPFGAAPQPEPENYQRILWVPFRGWSYPYIETILEEICRTQNPAAILIYHAVEVGMQSGFCLLLDDCTMTWCLQALEGDFRSGFTQARRLSSSLYPW